MKKIYDFHKIITVTKDIVSWIIATYRLLLYVYKQTIKWYNHYKEVAVSIHNRIKAKLKEIAEAREYEAQYYASSSNGNPRVIQSIAELKSLMRSHELEMELLELYRKR